MMTISGIAKAPFLLVSIILSMTLLLLCKLLITAMGLPAWWRERAQFPPDTSGDTNCAPAFGRSSLGVAQ